MAACSIYARTLALVHAAVLLALDVSPRRGNQHARANRVMLIHGGGISMRVQTECSPEWRVTEKWWAAVIFRRN
jgi:hypothetical protein